MRNVFAGLLVLLAGCFFWADRGPVATAVSPDGRNEIRLWTDPLAYEVVRDGAVVVARSAIGMKIEGACLVPGGERLVRKEKKSGSIETPVYKKSRIDLAGNETFADFGVWGVRLAARNDGVAYRFETKLGGEIRVDDETATVALPDRKTRCALNYGKNLGCEETIPISCGADEILTGNAENRRHVYLPFVYETDGTTVAVTESDVFDYPVWNLTRTDPDGGVVLDSVFARWPRRTCRHVDAPNWVDRIEVPFGGRWIAVLETEDYLVKTAGTRTFPWRTFVLADAPAKLCESDIVTALARPASGRDFSWVKPGKVAWDWWNAWDNKGVRAGCTTDGYKRFVDFAARTGVEYVIMDEGWSERLDIWRFNPSVDVPEVIRYGNEKGVGIILWMAWAQIVGEEAKVARHFAELGAKGFKVDFMDRGDAQCERFLWAFAEECSKNRMLLDYHGAHRPTGMSRAYPNVLNYEGVHGLENAKWFKNDYDFTDNDVKHFFVRMTAGPLDYTPGAMNNYPVGKYSGTDCNPGSVGTRCRQMAMMTLYEAPLQMLCDAPSKYEKNVESFRFMAETPVVWADTVGLGGSPDTFAAVARKAKDGSWYAAAINGKDPREFVLDTSFLGAGEWRAEAFRDAADADARPENYLHETKKVVSGGSFAVDMAPGGGFIVRFTCVEK